MTETLQGQWQFQWADGTGVELTHAPSADSVNAMAKPASSADPDGFFVIARPTRTHRYGADAAAGILGDVAVLDVEDNAALLEFVKRWGLVRLPAGWQSWSADLDGTEHSWAESVTHTRAVLRETKRLTRYLAAIKAKKWRSPDLPTTDQLVFTLDAARESAGRAGIDTTSPLWTRYSRWRSAGPQLRTLTVKVARKPRPVKLAPGDRKGLLQLGLALEITGALSRTEIRPLLSYDEQHSSFVSAFRPATLADIIFVTLWQKSIEGETVSRYCASERCRRLFFVNATDKRTKYCFPACGNRVRVARSYWKKSAARQKKGVWRRNNQRGRSKPSRKALG